MSQYAGAMEFLSVPDLVKTHVLLPTHPSAQGWYPVLCKVCNDHGRKGPRGAFKFEDGGVAYHCFNCSHNQGSGSYSPGKNTTIPKRLEYILRCFGVPEDEISKTKFGLLKTNNSAGPQKSQPRVSNYEPAEIALPSHFKPLSYDSVWCDVAREYLLDRMIDPDSHPFMISTGMCEDLQSHPKPVQIAMANQAKKWVGRVIVPVYKDNRLVFYVGRDMTGKKTKKYESPSVPKHSVLYGFDAIFAASSSPLYIVEGIFDAMVIDGVAILGNELHDHQIYWINKSGRKKVYIPDRFGDGHITAQKAAKLGWSVAFPEISPCKDINEAVQKFGRLYVLSSIARETASGEAALMRIGMYCK